MLPDRRLLAAFLLPHAGKSLLWTATDTFSLFILIRVLGIEPALAGIVFVLSSFWNAFADGMWGNALSRTPALNRLLPTICGLATVTGCAALAVLPWLPQESPLFAMIALVLFRTLFSLLDVPHNAAGAQIAVMHGHLVLARWRAILGAVTALSVAGAAVPLLNGGPDMNGSARMIFGATALLAFILMMPLPWLLQRVGSDHSPAPQTVRSSSSLLPHRAILIFCMAQMIGFAAMASVAKGIMHADMIFPQLMAYALLFLNILRLLSIVIWSPIAARIGSGRALAWVYVGVASATAALPCAIWLGPTATITAMTAIGIFMGGTGLLCWSAFSETLARLGIDTDPGAAANSYGWFTATSKIGLGFSGLLTGTWLSYQGAHLGADALLPLALLASSLAILSAFISSRGFARPGPWTASTQPA